MTGLRMWLWYQTQFRQLNVGMKLFSIGSILVRAPVCSNVRPYFLASFCNIF